jgi:hypothetical protein
MIKGSGPIPGPCIRAPIPHRPRLVVPHYRVSPQTGEAVRIAPSSGIPITRIQLLVPVLRAAPEIRGWRGLIVKLVFEVSQPIQNDACRFDA